MSRFNHHPFVFLFHPEQGLLEHRQHATYLSVQIVNLFIDLLR